jgi:putative ABC transport system ATP-binding protein
MVECIGISKTYPSDGEPVYALRGIDLRVAKGEIMMLVGPSGCGKTTLISIIAGILKYEVGSCRVLGFEISAMRKSELLDFRAQNIGFIFQAYNLLPHLTLAENVAVPLLIGGMSLNKALIQAGAALESVGLGARLDNIPAQLSGGQQQRVAIARALVKKPKLIVCDEPTSALDHDTGMKVMDLMQELVRGQGTTLVVVTHDNRIFHYADRIARMDDGQVVEITDAHALQSGSQAAH